MIFYETGNWHIRFVFSCAGSVIPRAAVWAILPTIVSVIINDQFYDEGNHSDTFATQAWYACSFLLSFLVVFRTQQAYSRFWEGVSLLHKTKGDWLNATSCIIAFCTLDPKRHEEVLAFQHYLVRLMSLLHCSAMQQVTSIGHDEFEIIDFSGIEEEQLEFLCTHPDNKCLILMQWIQRSIVKGIASGLLPVAPPIMTRTFQQLGDGYTNLIEAQKVTDIPFPFPFAQMVTLLLMVASCVTPVVCALSISSPYWSGGLTFLSVFGFWAINYIAAEIERPFGDDANDLPIDALQSEMNRDLKVLLATQAQTAPQFDFRPVTHERLIDVTYGTLTAAHMDQVAISQLPSGLQAHVHDPHYKHNLAERIKEHKLLMKDAAVIIDMGTNKSKTDRSMQFEQAVVLLTAPTPDTVGTPSQDMTQPAPTGGKTRKPASTGGTPPALARGTPANVGALPIPSGALERDALTADPSDWTPIPTNRSEASDKQSSVRPGKKGTLKEPASRVNKSPRGDRSPRGDLSPRPDGDRAPKGDKKQTRKGDKDKLESGAATGEDWKVAPTSNSNWGDTE